MCRTLCVTSTRPKSSFCGVRGRIPNRGPTSARHLNGVRFSRSSGPFRWSTTPCWRRPSLLRASRATRCRWSRSCGLCSAIHRLTTAGRRRCSFSKFWRNAIPNRMRISDAYSNTDGKIAGWRTHSSLSSSVMAKRFYVRAPFMCVAPLCTSQPSLCSLRWT